MSEPIVVIFRPSVITKSKSIEIASKYVFNRLYLLKSQWTASCNGIVAK